MLEDVPPGLGRSEVNLNGRIKKFLKMRKEV
jgi:hypothetical protein